MLKVYSVRDIKADAFDERLMCLPTVGIAERGFIEACLNPKSDMSQYPADYSLFEIGTYEPNTGALTAHQPSPIYVLSAVEAIARGRRAAEAKRLVNEPTLPGVEVAQ